MFLWLVVFYAFSRSQIVVVAELGFGLVVSIIIDATLITLIMSPAVMKMLGRWFWYWPAFLSWVPDLRARPPEEAEPWKRVAAAYHGHYTLEP